jgi:signal recognition particle subunit SRP54
MTPEERTDPAMLNGSRRARIANGSGTSVAEINRLIKQFSETRKMMRMMTTGKGKAMRNALSGNMPRR